MSNKYSSALLSIIFTAFLYSGFSHSDEDVNTPTQDSPQAYIELAISQQKTAPEDARQNLEKAFLLAEKQNNTDLIALIYLEQAQLGKITKDYLSSEKYLSKAEALIPSITKAEISVRILTNMSNTQRYLKDFDLSMDYVQKALAKAREHGKSQLILKGLQSKANLFKVLKRYEDSLSTYLLALRYLSQATTKEKVGLYQDIANAYKRINENESSIRYFKKSLKVLEETDDNKKIAKTLLDIAKIQLKLANFTSAVVNGKRSLATAKRNGDEKNTLKALVVLSKIYRKLSSYEEALIYGLEALKIYQENKDANGFASAANAVGLIYVHLDQNTNATNYFSQVVKLPEKKVQVKYRAAALRELGKLVYMDGESSKGLALSNEAFTLYEKMADKNGIATVKKNIGFIYYQMGNIVEATNAYNTAISLFQSMKDIWNEADTKAYLAIVLAEQDTDMADLLANESLKLANDIGAKSITEQSYTALILVEEKRKNFKQALAYAKKKEAVINDIKKDAINKRLAEVYIILEVEKTEREAEAFKRQKEVISFELIHQESNEKIREKEDRIKDLDSQKSAIILGIILFVIGRLYFKIEYRFVIPLIVGITLMFYSFQSHGADVDVIKLTHAESTLDVRTKYTHAVLKKSLEISRDKYGAFKIELIKGGLTSDRKIMEVHDGKNINLAMAMTSPDWEYLALPVRIPIRRGIANYRLLTINKHNKDRFKEVNSLRELKKLTVGLKKDWTLMDILDAEDFKIVDGLTYNGMFKMLNKMRFDYIPRGVHEAYDEIDLRKDKLKNLIIEPRLALYIPQPYYIFVSPKHPRIAERIEYGLEKMVAEGILQKMFDDEYGHFLKQANLANRKIIFVGNKYLTQKTPLDRKDLWLSFDLEQKK